ncbi:hypothetical protein GCM10025868_09540 [Angustibacter aerolatus]|uniref:Uncharacterized protein n=1 Tax=Angustibacter aerolatus TaxID=1162965 RepID=A0ABQ6JE62_9ACTN|nr:hypothetical protein GCM10025868_09540 [Angustibacter aerolatus]
MTPASRTPCVSRSTGSSWSARSCSRCATTASAPSLRYWDEAEDVDDAAALALRLWGDHRAACGLPSWRVVGLEVLDRDTVHARGAGRPASPLVAAGVTPSSPTAPAEPSPGRPRAT